MHISTWQSIVRDIMFQSESDWDHAKCNNRISSLKGLLPTTILCGGRKALHMTCNFACSIHYNQYTPPCIFSNVPHSNVNFNYTYSPAELQSIECGKMFQWRMIWGFFRKSNEIDVMHKGHVIMVRRSIILLYNIIYRSEKGK